jgi:signal-transduction protein with cAMP-binding, CBS, and nucleotidyltransferase domain
LVRELFKAGEMVISEGTVGNKFYMIEYGVAKVFNRDMHQYLYVGNYFGEAALVTEKNLRGAR